MPMRTPGAHGEGVGESMARYTGPAQYLLIATLCGAVAGAALISLILLAAGLGIAGQAVVVGMAIGLGAAIARTAFRWRRQSLTDDATGLYNRRYLFLRLQRELRRAQAGGQPLAFLVLEIDDMKRCNDTYGHLIGDALLAAVAQALRAGVRQSDIVVRWGGDEFGVILPRTHVHEALVMAERMRTRIAELTVDAGEGRQARTTISVGVAVNMARESTTDLISRADQAMYAAKQRKNLVIVAA